MERINLEAKIRRKLGKRSAKRLRREDKIPAISYGEGKSIPVFLEKKDMLKILQGRRGENLVINLKIKSDHKIQSAKTVIIKEIQRDPVRDEIIHIDFAEVLLNKPISVKVPIVLKKEPVGVKQEGGSLEHLLWELEIECLPTEIPPSIEIDVSNLRIGQSIQVKDITPSQGIKILGDPEAVICAVVVVKEKPEEVVEEVPEEKPEPEVIKKEKKEETEEEA